MKNISENKSVKFQVKIQKVVDKKAEKL